MVSFALPLYAYTLGLSVGEIGVLVSIRTVVAVPLRGRDAVLGVLALYDPRSDGAGSEDDLTTLRTLAGQAAVAVENVRVSAAAMAKLVAPLRRMIS